MRGVWVLFAVCVAQVLLFAGAAQALGTSFFDDFLAFDESRWTETEHDLGRSHLDPANVEVVDGNARFKIPERTLQGAEIRSDELYRHGTYSTSMKLPNAPSSITGFFLYKAPDLESEVDIEVFNDSTRRIMFTTYSGGRQTHTETARLPFDPTTGFHEYSFDYSQNAVTFYVDGVEMRTWETGIPQTSMHLMVNSWFPNWLEGRKPKKNAYTYVDWISYEARPPAG